MIWVESSLESFALPSFQRKKSRAFKTLCKLPKKCERFVGDWDIRKSLLCWCSSLFEESSAFMKVNVALYVVLNHVPQEFFIVHYAYSAWKLILVEFQDYFILLKPKLAHTAANICILKRKTCLVIYL